MGASQSSQPPSRHNSRHGTDSSKHKSKAASVSSTPKPPLPVIIDNVPSPIPPPIEVRSVPIPAVAVPIPVKKKPVSLPTSGENSYIDQHKDVDFIHRLEKLELDKMEEEGEGDEPEAESKFGIEWAPSDDFEEDTERKFPSKKYPLTIEWAGGGRDVRVLGTFTQRQQLPLKKIGNIFTITVDAEPGGHRFRFLVDRERRTSPDYKLATDHQNVVVNYIDHHKPDTDSVGSYESYHDEDGIASLVPSNEDYYQPPPEVWTREIPSYYLRRRDSDYSASPGSSHSSTSSRSSLSLSRFLSIPQAPGVLNKNQFHPLNPGRLTGTDGERRGDQSVLNPPSHAVLGHLAIRGTRADGTIASTITTRYKHKVIRLRSG